MTTAVTTMEFWLNALLGVLIAMIGAGVVIRGWHVAHQREIARDQIAKRRELRLQFLIDAYRRLEFASNRPIPPHTSADFEKAIADIQLFGAASQVALVKTRSCEGSTPLLSVSCSLSMFAVSLCSGACGAGATSPLLPESRANGRMPAPSVAVDAKPAPREEAGAPAFLFCYSPDFENAPLLLLYSTTLDSDAESFASDCTHGGSLSFARDAAYCWVTLDPSTRIETGSWDQDWIVHRCYATEELCNDQRRSMIINWEERGSPIPLIGSCRTTAAHDEFLRFTKAIEKRKSR